jgi:hypothetical protein
MTDAIELARNLYYPGAPFYSGTEAYKELLAAAEMRGDEDSEARLLAVDKAEFAREWDRLWVAGAEQAWSDTMEGR